MLIKALESGVHPSHDQIAELREQAALWREQLDRVRQRLAGVTIEPPSRPQYDNPMTAAINASGIIG